MTILAIETSCDETGIALVEAKGGLDNPQFEVLENLITSQIDVHRPWGGVVPGLAKREHAKNLPVLTKRIFGEKMLRNNKIERIAVTVGPGLDPCLWEGINFAKKLFEEQKDYGLKVEKSGLAGANHLEGHLYGFLLTKKGGFGNEERKIKELFPAVQLVVSGGHTILVLMNSLSDWKIVGETQDDAAGEAFDKVARMLGLPYPGGPEISSVARKGDAKAINFPRPMMASNDYNFSFSGLKTAVFYYLRENSEGRGDKLSFMVSEKMKNDVAASFQEAVVDVLTKKTARAVKKFKAKSIMLSGGVAANETLRERLRKAGHELSVDFVSADKEFQTDNGAVIAVSSYINFLAGKSYKLESQPNLGL